MQIAADPRPGGNSCRGKKKLPAMETFKLSQYFRTVINHQKPVISTTEGRYRASVDYLYEGERVAHLIESHLLTPRHERERQFYDEYSKRNEAAEICFDPVTAKQPRPWNSYWYAIGLAKEHFRKAGQKLLDFGCGPGEFSLLYAKIGYQVYAFDLSENNIFIARERADKYQFSERARFSVGIAEELGYPSDYFDVIMGVDILHHVDINRAISECARVLKKGGIAIFHEPVQVPAFERLRESRIGMRLAPKKKSYDLHLTDDERKLTADELQCVTQLGTEISVKRFHLTSRLSRFIKNRNGGRPAVFEKLDERLIRAVPSLGNYGGIVVVKVTK
jgi:ubiquinone/menaquinone biosynthesis C-methylase UbiE